MAIGDRTPGIAAESQELQGLGTGWSGDAQLFVRAKGIGDFVELVIPAKGAAARKLVLHATRASDYGKLRFTVNGKAAAVAFDGYAVKPTPTGPINLGLHEPKDGKFVLRAEVVGTSPDATGDKYFFGLDAVLLENP